MLWEALHAGGCVHPFERSINLVGKTSRKGTMAWHSSFVGCHCAWHVGAFKILYGVL